MVRLLISKNERKAYTPIVGLRAARVRVLFQLPSLVAQFPHPLAYIDWFVPFARYVKDPGLFAISRSSRWGYQNSEVISITDIERTCHLVPLSSAPMDRTWNSSNVLDCAQQFWLNPYLRHQDFCLLRYQHRLLEKEEEERQAYIQKTIGRNRVNRKKK